MSREVTISTLFEQDKWKYLAIIFFMMEFRSLVKEFRLYHYRFALQKNHNLSPSFQKSLTKKFGMRLEAEYKNTYSPIKKVFDSRSNLVEHLNTLARLEVVKKEPEGGEYFYRLNDNIMNQIMYAYTCAWFSALIQKVPPELLQKMRSCLESNFDDELKQYNAKVLLYGGNKE